MPDEKNESTELLGKHEAPVLDESDKKIAKKRAKKNNIPVEAAEEGRRQEKSIKIVQQLTNEYNAKLNELGFVLEAVIKFSPKGIKPGFDLRPMNAAELEFWKESRKKKEEGGPTDEAAEETEDEKPVDEAEEETGPAEETTEAESTEGEAPVEPLDVPQA